MTFGETLRCLVSEASAWTRVPSACGVQEDRLARAASV